MIFRKLKSHQIFNYILIEIFAFNFVNDIQKVEIHQILNYIKIEKFAFLKLKIEQNFIPSSMLIISEICHSNIVKKLRVEFKKKKNQI